MYIKRFVVKRVNYNVVLKIRSYSLVRNLNIVDENANLYV